MIFVIALFHALFIVLGVVFLFLLIWWFLEDQVTCPPKRSYKFKIKYDEELGKYVLLQKRILGWWYAYKNEFETKEKAKCYMHRILIRYAEDDEKKGKEQFYEFTPIKDRSRLLENKPNDKAD